MSRPTKFTIRHFSRNFYSCLEELPVIVTKHGKPYLKIERFNVTTNTTKDEIVTTQNDTTTPNVTTSKKKVIEELRNDPDLNIVRAVPKPEPPKKGKMGYKGRFGK